jgi:hypothetical protein
VFRSALVSRLAPIVTIAPLIALAYQIRFVMDDAYISFRYARHLTDGWGLVWNQGERIEGFTNLLWTLLIAAGMKLGADPVSSAHVLGLTCYAATLASSYLLLSAFGVHRINCHLAVICLGLNYSFAAFATGGLETSLQTATIAGSFAIFALGGRDRLSASIALSVVLAAAVWTRLDATLCAGLLLSVRALENLGWAPFRSNGPPLTTLSKSSRIRLLIALFAPFGLLVGGLFAFKLVYFGAILPNTYFAKTFADPAVAVSFGWQQLKSFVDQYRFQPVGLLVCVGLVLSIRRRSRIGLLSAGFAIAWLAYLVWVGGDFMEYRFLVPALPFVIALAFLALTPLTRFELLTGVLLTAYCAFGSWEHYRHSQQSYYNESSRLTETVPFLQSHVDGPGQDWKRLGQGLGELLDYDESVTIAVYASGAIPYYSRARTIDMLGLNDWWVARFGLRSTPRPGHQRVAPLSYLLFRKTHLVIQPWPVGDPEERVDRYSPSHLFEKYVPAPSGIPLPPNAKIVELPLRPTPPTRALYLLPHPRIDRLIATRGLRTLPIEREE